jgi:nucleotide-binding universal stress UspA family protein
MGGGRAALDQDPVVDPAAEEAAMADWKKICCAVDFSEPSRLAMQEAADLARRLQAELTLLHVYEPRAPSPELLLEKLEEATAHLEREMGRLQVEAGEIAGRQVRTIILTGNVIAEILRYVRDGGFDLVVTATHGRTGLKRVLLGSVAERVVREAGCPVLVIRRSGVPGPG